MPKHAADTLRAMPKPKNPDDLLTHTGLRLKCARLALGLTQEALAAAIGVSRETLNNYERGARTPDPFAMARLELRYDIRMGWIYSGDIRHIPHETQTALLHHAARLKAQLGGLYAGGAPPAEQMLALPAPRPRRTTLHEDAAPAASPLPGAHR
jgi:transcriptional regulator with XRE-family HTH domain